MPTGARHESSKWVIRNWPRVTWPLTGRTIHWAHIFLTPFYKLHSHFSFHGAFCYPRGLYSQPFSNFPKHNLSFSLSHLLIKKSLSPKSTRQYGPLRLKARKNWECGKRGLRLREHEFWSFLSLRYCINLGQSLWLLNLSHQEMNDS